MGSPEVVVVGGGIIGMATAWEAARRGLSVTVVDPEPGAGATRAAGGMLAPVTEVHYGEESLLRLNLASSARYPDFVARVEEQSGARVGYRETGTLAVAFDTDDRAYLGDLLEYQRSLGLEVEALTGRECRALEPLLAPTVRGGILIAGDHSVDNRRLASALLTAAERAGVTVRRTRTTGIVVAGDRVGGVRLADGSTLPAGQVVLAAGAWSATLDGLPEDLVPPVRPVKGQILRLRVPREYRPFLSRTVRGTVRGHFIYLVPRADGELVVGATAEEQSFDTRVTAGGVYELLRDGHELVPGLTELELVEALAGLRPGSPDNAPLIGATELPGLVLATGHFRNGILLAPVTADAVATLLAEGTVPAVAEPFSPRRLAASSPEVPA